MIEQNGSDPMFGKEKDEDDQDIIELTDEVALEPTTNDDDIIELISEVEEADGEADDEDILELTSEVDKGTQETDDEEILELTSEVEEAFGEEPAELTLEVEEFEGEDEEDLLDLMSEEPETTTVSQSAAVIEEEIPETVPTEGSEFHEFVEMDSQAELLEKDIDLAAVMGIELDPARDLSLESQGDDIEVELEGLEGKTSKETPTIIIPGKQLEAAIERVVETKLAEKIDRLLTDAIEKAVTTEIGRLKRLLTKDLPDD